MTMVATGVGSDLDRALAAVQERSGFAVVFAGRVRSGTLRISNLRGNRSEALRGLSLPPGVGLGGKATTLGRPVSVRDYSCALAITHEYDSAVAREGLRALVAVPARVHGQVSVVIYGGVRAAMSIGDRAIADLVTAGRQVSLDLEAAAAATASSAVDDERGSRERGEMPGRAHWCAVVEGIVSELGQMSERPVQAKARTACLELLDVLRGEADRGGAPTVRPSDVRVLELVSLGCTDRDIADRLGIELHTVRRRMRMLRKTFGVHSRYAAVSAARVAGVLS